MNVNASISWNQPLILGAIPPPRYAHTTTLISPNKLIIFGGCGTDCILNDLYILDLCTLSKILL